MFVCCSPRGSQNDGIRVPELLLPDQPSASPRRYDTQIHGYVSITPTSGYRQREKVVITPRSASTPPTDTTSPSRFLQPVPLLRKASEDSAPRLAAIAEESTHRAPSEQQPEISTVRESQAPIAARVAPPPPPPPPVASPVIQVAQPPPPPPPVAVESPLPPEPVVQSPPPPEVQATPGAAQPPPPSAPTPPSLPLPPPTVLPPPSDENRPTPTPPVQDGADRRDPKSDEAPLQIPLPANKQEESPQAIDAPVPMSEKEFRSRVGSLGVPSKDPETLTPTSTTKGAPKSKAAAKKPPPARGTRSPVPNAKAAGGTGLRTRDRNKMVDLLDEREKKDILRVCHFARESIDVDPAADASVCERESAFLLAALLFAVKLESQGKQNPVGTAIAHMVDLAEGEISTAKAKKAAPKVAFLLRRVAEPLINALRVPDPKHDKAWVAKDLRDTASVMMGEKPPGLKDRMPYLEDALEHWTYQSLLQAAKDDPEAFEKLRLALADAFDDCRNVGSDLGLVQDAVSKIESII